MIFTPPVSEARPLPVARRARRARRILMVAPTSFFADYGCHVRILEEVRALTRLGQRVTVVTYRNGRSPAGLDVRRTLPIPWRRDYEVGSSRHKLAFDGLLGWSTLWAALRLKPDVVHGHLHEGALIGGAAARLLGRPVVFDFQGSLTGEMLDHGFLRPGGRFHDPIRRLEGLIDRHVDAIVISSGRAAGQLLGDFGVDARRLYALPDCVDGANFRPDVLAPGERADLRGALGLPAGSQVVVYLGLLARHQGIDLLVEAARRVAAARADAHFLVMGFPAPHVYQAQAEAAGLADRMTFTGRVAYEEAPRRLALGDLAVAPKVSATEGNGKLLNYMAMALPTVAFDNPVSREYLAEDGLYATAVRADALADALLGALAEPAASRARGLRLRQRALALYDWEHAGASLLALYDRLLLARRLESPV